LVAGLPMHRIKDTDPWADSQAKIATLAPVSGRSLDTATGLGYTAILAARIAEEVVTIELDPAALEIAAMNPWSRELFTQANIRQLVGDAVEILPTLEDGGFTRILHDPPMITIAGDLYGEAFYRELWRVLRRGGRLFHYIGDPESASGRRTTAGVIRRLQSAGFSRVMRRPEAFGVLAQK
jgi:predicted methyltransferase